MYVTNLIKAQMEVFTDGNFKLQFERMDIPISKRLRKNLMFKRNFGMTTHYDSDMGMGFGLSLNY